MRRRSSGARPGSRLDGRFFARGKSEVARESANAGGCSRALVGIGRTWLFCPGPLSAVWRWSLQGSSLQPQQAGQTWTLVSRHMGDTRR